MAALRKVLPKQEEGTETGKDPPPGLWPIPIILNPPFPAPPTLLH